MYKLLIVDDEYIVRQGLRKIVPWNAMGVLVAGEAGSVEEAVKTAAKLVSLQLAQIHLKQ